MESVLLKTGEVAEMLGVSRQHVVNLADRGDVASVRVGSHRRIPRSEVDRLRGYAQLSSERLKSLRLHQALIADLLVDPEGVISKARSNIERWLPEQRVDGMTAAYLRDWESVLVGGVDQIIHVITSLDERSADLRENSPFAGVMSPERRTKILRTIREQQAAALR
ncbi:helix-turn-helix domain-containing protein [Aeromicrobium stalagmiti]|uniref:helix-turn-helix domain-containing protein n=1 Tax=Aeromicrobium stalagmiti TaxID=2738988 RepID=UPI001569B72D|nr:helix-turn-helix domain-containing protein [Aeromicrobium stalagmiti]NRQ49203.1 helix-turn-helix domain-containing protein [Aeromicrobium stalagmiti]